MKSTDLSITPFLILVLISLNTGQATTGLITCCIIFRGSFNLFLSNALILGGVSSNYWLILKTDIKWGSEKVQTTTSMEQWKGEGKIKSKK